MMKDMSSNIERYADINQRTIASKTECSPEKDMQNKHKDFRDHDT
jgi:hypothetical protein